MKSRHLRRWPVAALLAVVSSADVLAQTTGPTQSELDRSATSTATWLMTNKSYDGHRYVSLNQITRQNVANLKDVCTFDTGVQAPAQSSPVLYEGRIYFTAAQTTVAIEAVTCRQVWRHDWKLDGKILSPVNRGPAIKDGRLVRGTSDGHLIALSMADGKLLWDRKITSYEESHYLSMPPMIVEDRVIYGTAGADWGGPGWIGAFSLKDGTELWRYAPLPMPGTANADTWGSPQALAHGGGNYWTPVSVDRQRGIVFVATGNPAPDFFGEMRPGANLGSNTAVALDLKTGKMLWAKQFTPHDTHDWDLTQVSPLLRANVNGKPRDLVMVSGKDGYLRGVDRESSDVLYQLAISKQEGADNVASATPTHVCPGLLGGQEWSSTAYDEAGGLTISPMVDWCGMVSHEATPPQYQVGVHYYGGKIEQEPIGQARGVLAAVDAGSGNLRWKFAAPAPMLANVTVTSSRLVFAGDLKGNLYAVDSETGKELLRHSLPSSAGGGMLTYDNGGKQYLAVISGSVSGFFGGGNDTVKLTVLSLP